MFFYLFSFVWGASILNAVSKSLYLLFLFKKNRLEGLRRSLNQWPFSLGRIHGEPNITVERLSPFSYAVSILFSVGKPGASTYWIFPCPKF